MKIRELVTAALVMSLLTACGPAATESDTNAAPTATTTGASTVTKPAPTTATDPTSWGKGPGCDVLLPADFRRVFGAPFELKDANGDPSSPRGQVCDYESDIGLVVLIWLRDPSGSQCQQLFGAKVQDVAVPGATRAFIDQGATLDVCTSRFLLQFAFASTAQDKYVALAAAALPRLY